MKNMMNNMIRKSLMISGLAAMLLGANACQSEEVVLPEFPKTEKVYFSPDESVKEISFSANYPWTLTSSAIWCKFEDQTQVQNTVINGQAGEAKVKIVISDEGMNPGEISDVAIIEMQMEEEIRVFAEVYRSAKGYEFTLVDAEGNAIDPKDWTIEVGYEELLPFSVKANFDFALTGRPGWLQIGENNAFTGAAGEICSTTASFVNDGESEKYPIEKSDDNVVVFSDKDGKVFFPVQLHFAGMPADEISFEGPTARPDWKVSMDGKTFVQTGFGVSQEESKTLYHNKLDINVKALNDEFEVIYLEQAKNEWGMTTMRCSIDPDDPFESWMSLDGEKGDMSLTVEPAETERKGYVLVFTKAQLDSLGISENPVLWYDHFVELSMNPETMENEYAIEYTIAQSHLLAEFHQKDEKPASAAKEIKVTDKDMNELPYERVTDPGILSDYGIADIFSVAQTVQSINIEHLIDGEMGVDWIYAAYNMAGEDKSDMIEPMGNVINIYFEEPLAAGDRIDIIFRNPMTYENIKVVIIESVL